MSVPMEFGPDGAILPPGLPRHLFGYGPGPLPQAIGQALSTGRAIAGYAGTAMSQLDALTKGVQPQLVINDLFRPIR